MNAPMVERLPPVTIEFLRIVNGVEATRLSCMDCNEIHVMSWEEIGLPDDTPFPPPEGFWKCGSCGGANVTAEPEWPFVAARVRQSPVEDVVDPPANDLSADGKEIAADLRDQPDAIMVRLGKF